MPVILELFYFSINFSGFLILIEYSSCLSVIISAHNEDKFLSFAGFKGDIALESAA